MITNPAPFPPTARAWATEGKRPILGALCILTCAMLISGCGGTGRLPIKGRLLKNGAPYLPAEGDIVRVMFVPIPEGKEKVTDFHAATFHPEDGTFQAEGR